MRNRWIFALSVLFVFALLSAAPSQAQVNSCTASGLFGSCKVTCPADQTPVCSSYGLWVSCYCEKRGISDASRAQIGMNDTQAKNLQGYIAVTSGFDTEAGQQVATSAINAYEALLARNSVVFHANRLAHDEAARHLNADEQAKVDEYVSSLK